MKSMVLIVDYFGRWPDWFDIFLTSCGSNPTVDWHINTDCPIPETSPRNVTFKQMSFRDYCSMVSEKLEINFAPASAYNLCNLRPTYGVIHEHIIAPYDFFGWCDLDIILGDIRSFYTDQILQHNAISTHKDICSGHFFLMRNAPCLRNVYKYIPSWRRRLEATGPCAWQDSLDEALLTAIFCPIESTRKIFVEQAGFGEIPAALYENNYFTEQWSTPFTPNPWIGGTVVHPDVWYWNDGALSNATDGDRRFLYLHLMNFKSRRWVNDSLYSDAPTWDQLETCMRFAPSTFSKLPHAQQKLQIDRSGIHLL